jgi:hypothetical protein
VHKLAHRDVGMIRSQISQHLQWQLLARHCQEVSQPKHRCKIKYKENNSNKKVFFMYKNVFTFVGQELKSFAAPDSISKHANFKSKTRFQRYPLTRQGDKPAWTQMPQAWPYEIPSFGIKH